MTIKKPECILDKSLTILVGYLSRFPSHKPEIKEMSTVSICSDNPVESEYGSIPSHPDGNGILSVSFHFPE